VVILYVLFLNLVPSQCVQTSVLPAITNSFSSLLNSDAAAAFSPCVIDFRFDISFFPNVTGQISLLASGTEGAQAASVTEVPQAQGLAAPACSVVLFLELINEAAQQIRFIAEIQINIDRPDLIAKKLACATSSAFCRISHKCSECDFRI